MIRLFVLETWFVQLIMMNNPPYPSKSSVMSEIKKENVIKKARLCRACNSIKYNILSYSSPDIESYYVDKFLKDGWK